MRNPGLFPSAAFLGHAQSPPPAGRPIQFVHGWCGDSNWGTIEQNVISHLVMLELSLYKDMKPYTIAITGVSGANGGGINTVTITAAGSSTLTVALTYKVGDVAPYSSDVAPNFGDGTLNILDLVQVLFSVNNVPGFQPAACSDRFDAMDLYPVDTTARGGDGVLDIRDLIRELFRVKNLDMDRPVRTSRGGACATGLSAPKPTTSESAALKLKRPEVEGAVQFGEAEMAGAAGVRVAVYLEARRELTRVALTLGVGTPHSQLRFTGAPGAPPTLVQDSQLGVVALAWLDGLSLRAGERLLLGYVTGATGIAADLRVYGMSASGLDDNRDVPMATPGAKGLDR